MLFGEIPSRVHVIRRLDENIGEKVKKMSKKLMPVLSRFFACFLFVLLLVVSTPPVRAADRHDIQIQYQRDDYQQIAAKLNYSGRLLIQDFKTPNEPARALRFRTETEIKYNQRFTGKSDLQAIRCYDPSSISRVAISDGNQSTQLDESNRYIIARVRDGKPVQHASIGDVLQQKELELIQVPADPLCFANVFNQKNVTIGNSWQPTNEALSTFLSVDRVYDNEVDITLKTVSQDIAKLHMIGTAKAEIHDVTTVVDVSAAIMIDLKKSSAVALRATINQQREVGQIAPGFEGKTKIDLRLKSIQPVDELSNRSVARRSKSKKIERRLKWKPDPGHFAIMYDPRWHVIATDKEAAVLRYIDDGDLLAQCNIVQLPSRPADQPLTMVEFKDYIEKLVSAEDSARLANFRQLKTSAGLTALNVVVEGTEKGVPLTWNYYHVSSEDGRRVTIVFTLEREIAGRFSPADQKLVDALVFTPLPAERKAENAQSRKSR